MQDTELQPGDRVRDAVSTDVGRVTGVDGDRWLVVLDDGRKVQRYAAQLTLTGVRREESPRFAPGYVAPSPNVGYFVKSRTSAGWWLVNDQGCECPATGPRCWHVQAVEAHVRAIDAKHKRPNASVNVSAMVD